MPEDQGPLFDLPAFTILNAGGVPVGHWTIYAGVDAVQNGNLDLGAAVYDSVEVTVAPSLMAYYPFNN